MDRLSDDCAEFGFTPFVEVHGDIERLRIQDVAARVNDQ